MVRSAAFCFAVALLFSTAGVAQQPSFGNRNGYQWDRGRPAPDHRRYDYAHGYRDGRPGGVPGLVPGLLLGLGLGMIPFVLPPPPGRVVPGAWPQPGYPQGPAGMPPGYPQQGPPASR
jgi:hypothetical protein